MNDMISRQAAINKINERQRKLIYCFGFENDMVKIMDIAKSIITAIPPAQPQITHCAECIHWKHSDVRKNYCEVFDWMNKAEDFCSFAERKDTE